MKTEWRWEKRSYGWGASTAKKDTVVQLRVHTCSHVSPSYSAERRGLYGDSLNSPGLTSVYGHSKTVANAKRAAEGWGTRLLRHVQS